jgi:hypothetical protein
MITNLKKLAAEYRELPEPAKRDLLVCAALAVATVVVMTAVAQYEVPLDEIGTYLLRH